MRFHLGKTEFSDSDIVFHPTLLSNDMMPTSPTPPYVIVQRVALDNNPGQDQIGLNAYTLNQDTGLIDYAIISIDLTVTTDLLKSWMVHEIGHSYGIGNCTDCTDTVMHVPIITTAFQAPTICDLQNIYDATSHLYGYTNAPDFILNASPGSACQYASDQFSSDYSINVVPLNGFTGSVSLSVPNLPPYFGQPALSANQVTAGGSTDLFIYQTAPPPPGDYTINITGTWFGRSRGANVVHQIRRFAIVPVDPLPEGSTPPTRTVIRGSQTTYRFRLSTPDGNCNRGLYFLTSPLPSFVKATFSPTTLTDSGSETVMTVDVQRKQSQVGLIVFQVYPYGYSTGLTVQLSVQ